MAKKVRGEISDRLRQRILARLNLGLIASGDRLPSARELAQEFDADPRVVLAAYRNLEKEGIVEIRERSGVYATPNFPVSDQTQAPEEWLVEMISGSVARGINGKQLVRSLDHAVNGAPLAVFVIDDAADLLWSVTNELKRDYGVRAEPVDLDQPAAIKQALLLHGMPDLVVTTSRRADDIAGVSADLSCPIIVIDICTDLYSEVRELLAVRDVYFLVTDPRFGKRLRQTFRSSGHSDRLHVLVHGRDPADAVPPGAPFYITQLTRRHIPSAGLAERSLPEARVFSEESARDIASFVVRLNLARPASQAPGRA